MSYAKDGDKQSAVYKGGNLQLSEYTGSQPHYVCRTYQQMDA